MLYQKERKGKNQKEEKEKIGKEDREERIKKQQKTERKMVIISWLLCNLSWIAGLQLSRSIQSSSSRGNEEAWHTSRNNHLRPPF